MPMLITFLIFLPVAPTPCPLRTRSEKLAILSSTAWTSGTTFLPSTTIVAFLARPAGHGGARPLRSNDVDLFAAKHGVDPLAQARFVGQLGEQAERFVGHPILGVVEIDAQGLGGQPLAALRIVGEQFAQVQLAYLVVMFFQGFPGRSLSQRNCGHRSISFRLHSKIRIPGPPSTRAHRALLGGPRCGFGLVGYDAFKVLVADVGAVVPQADRRFGQRVLGHPENAAAWPSTERVAGRGCVEREPPRRQHAQKMSAGKDQRVAVDLPQASHDAIGPAADVGHRLAAGAAVAEQLPFGAACR